MSAHDNTSRYVGTEWCSKSCCFAVSLPVGYRVRETSNNVWREGQELGRLLTIKQQHLLWRPSLGSPKQDDIS